MWTPICSRHSAALLAHRAIVQQADRAAMHDLAVQEHVVIDAERIGQRQILVDALDPQCAGVIHRMQRHFAAGYEQPAAGRCFIAGEDLHQR